MSSTAPYRLTASQAAAEIRSGALTVEDYARSLLSRISQRDPEVKAWTHLNPDLVLAQARALDKLPPSQRGPLHGVAVAVKDVIYTRDMPTQHASPIYSAPDTGAHGPPGVDAASVMVLRAAGALILGKTTTPEFAAVTSGPATRNPLDLSRTPGGSSTGSAAAVADFQAAVGLGTQTGGSTIRPGSFCGVWALKPTWGAVSREGQKVYSITLDTLGLYARAAEDLEMLGDVLGVRDDEEKGSVEGFEVKGARFGVMRTMQWEEHVQPATRTAMESAVALLGERGAEVEDVELPEDLAELPRWHAIVLAAEGRKAFLPEYATARDKLHRQLVGHVENVEGYSHADYLRAFDSIAAARPTVDALLGRYAAVLTPSVPGEAPLGIESTGSPAFNLIWTVSLLERVLDDITALLCAYSLISRSETNGLSVRLFTFLSSTSQALVERTECRLGCPLWHRDTKTANCWLCQRRWAKYSAREGAGSRSFNSKDPAQIDFVERLFTYILMVRSSQLYA